MFRIRSLNQLGKNVRVRGGERKPSTRTRIPRGKSIPQERLWQLVKAQYPEAEQEKKGLVPGRRYVVDMVLEEQKLVIELDGWEWHGRSIDGFTRDREKDRLLLLRGYRVVRFTAGEVLKSPGRVMEILTDVVEMVSMERSDVEKTNQ